MITWKGQSLREQRATWVEGAKAGLKGDTFSMTPYPVSLKDKAGAPPMKSQQWARGYWWAQRCLQSGGKRVLSIQPLRSPKWALEKHLQQLGVAA